MKAEMKEIENKDKMRSTKPSSYCKKLVKKGKTLAQLAKNTGEKT